MPNGRINFTGKTYQRLIDTVNKFELSFARHDRLGWLTFSPTNLGTALKMAVELKLSKLHSNADKLEELVKAHSTLEVKQSDSGAENTYTVYNQSTMGFSEFDLVKQLYDGIRDIIEYERNDE